MRRAWRVTAALGVLLAAGSMLLSALLFARIQEERERRVRDQSRSDLTVCLRVERTNLVLTGLLEGVLRLPPNAGDDPARARVRDRVLREGLRDLEPTDCRMLPSQRPFRR